MEQFDLIIAQQPQWIQIWLNILFVGAFVLPLTLLVWRQTRLTAIITVISSVLGGIGVMLIFLQLGYVRLMGLAHVVVWTPLAIYLWRQQARTDISVAPTWIIRIVLVVIVISLIFDYTDVVRYLMGEREAVALAE